MLRNTFQETFSKDLLKNPSKRWPFEKWLNVISELRARLIINPNNNQEQFLMEFKNCCYLEINQSEKIVITPKKKIYLNNEYSPIAEVKTNRNNPGTWGLKNISKNKWTIETNSGKIKVLDNSEVMPVKDGLQISFNDSQQTKAKIIFLNQ